MKLQKTAFILFIFCAFLVTKNFAQNPQNSTKKGNLVFKVKNYQKAKDKIHELTTKLNGFIPTEKENNFQTKITNQLEIRIPNKNFNTLVQEIRALSSHVMSQNTVLVDCEKEKNKVIQRIAVQTSAKAKYEKLLERSKSANSIKDCQNKIEKANNLISHLEKEVKDLEQSNFSTVSLQFHQAIYTARPPKKEDLIDLSPQGVQKLVIIMIMITLPLLIISLVIWKLYKNAQKKKRKVKKRRKPSTETL